MDVVRARTFTNGVGRFVCEHRNVHIRPCPDCGKDHLLSEDPEAICFFCDMEKNGPAYSVFASIEVGSEDSKDPGRVRDGTASFNIGLPGVETVVGKRADGKPKLGYRPVSNNELSTNRARNEYAKRHGLVPMQEHTKRAVGR